MASGEEFTFFYTGDSTVFSQWYLTKFTIDGIEYNSAEQYMMYQKAVLFEDEEIAEKILKTPDPPEQKALGRQVRNFQDDKWIANCRDIVKQANYAKFSQNEELKEILFATKGTTLADASPHDKMWGIGLAEDDPNARKKKKWKGKNWLGYCITQVRDELMEKEDSK